MNTSKNPYQHLMAGLSFMMDILKFMSGRFAMSTLLFSAASLSSNLDFARSARAKA